MTKWDRRFLQLAEMVSTWSKDPSTKVGAVITNNKRVISLGFNGFASGLDDSKINDRDYKIQNVLHAEDNCILFAQKDLSQHTIYTWPFQPCARCSNKIIQVGIKRVVSITGGPERWQESFAQAKQNFEDAEVELYLIRKNLYQHGIDSDEYFPRLDYAKGQEYLFELEKT